MSVTRLVNFMKVKKDHRTNGCYWLLSNLDPIMKELFVFLLLCKYNFKLHIVCDSFVFILVLAISAPCAF